MAANFAKLPRCCGTVELAANENATASIGWSARFSTELPQTASKETYSCLCFLVSRFLALRSSRSLSSIASRGLSASIYALRYSSASRVGRPVALSPATSCSWRATMRRASAARSMAKINFGFLLGMRSKFAAGMVL